MYNFKQGVLTLQKIFTVTEGIYEYVNLGREYPFPTAPFSRCHKCGQVVHFKKHGFYERYLVCRFFNGRIIIRRYICPHCGCTISFLPDFCLPGYIHALEHIFEYTYRGRETIRVKNYSRSKKM